MKTEEKNVDFVESESTLQKFNQEGKISKEETAQDNDLQAVPSESEEIVIDFDKLLKSKKLSLFCKRFFDICASFCGILILSPLFIIISLAIVLTSKGSVFFCQKRMGKGEKEFKILKFRTMIQDAENKGLQITVGTDWRITRVGKFLRKYKLDELPQLINVFIGQMSFVGYRPEIPKYVDLYTKYQRNVFRIRPGITDLASIEFCDENELLENSDNPESVYINEVMQKKLNLNIKYIQKIGVVYDVFIIFKTFAAILKCGNNEL